MSLMPKLSVLKLSSAAAVVLLAGCGVVGDGTKLEKLRLVPQGSDTTKDLTRVAAFECFANQLKLYGEFENGDIGDFTDRNIDEVTTPNPVVYTSSNPAVLEVSNGEIPLPEQEDVPAAEKLFYPYAAVIPRTTGTATITATYLGLSASLEVVVKTPTDFEFTPTDVARMAPLTSLRYFVTAKLDGRKTDLSAQANWTLDGADPAGDDEDEKPLAVIGASSGVVQASKLVDGLTVKARFPLCDKEFQANLDVKPIKSLILTHQEGFTGELIKNTSELFKVMAAFVADPENPGQDLPEQDLTGQVIYSSSSTDTAVIGVALLSGKAAGTTNVVAKFDTDLENEPASGSTDPDPGLISSNTIPVTVVEATLNSLTISPDTATILSLMSQQYNVTGSYSGGRTQDITRHVGWSALLGDESTTEVQFLTATTPAGVATSRLNEAKTYTIKATVAKTDTTAEISDTASLTVEALPEP